MHKLQITGTVQGVGFRPFILREAKRCNLKGYVKNTGDGVEIVTDNETKIHKILNALPPLAKIDNIEVTKLKSSETFSDFTIHESSTKNQTCSIPPDIGTCNKCQTEVLDPKNPRYLHPFISCTDCGPRFSIVENLPFDRENTSLKNFELCEFCSSEYEDSGSRRLHAQTISCKECGPRYELITTDGSHPHLASPVRGRNLLAYAHDKSCNTNANAGVGFRPAPHISNNIKQTAIAIKSNKIIAIKSIGGFTLACNLNKKTVQELRTKIHRPNKPFALMAKDISMIKKFAQLSKKEIEILKSTASPIVLLKKIDNTIPRACSRSPDVSIFESFFSPARHEECSLAKAKQAMSNEAGGKKGQKVVHLGDFEQALTHISENNRLGFMLPYTGFHTLLFQNLDEPIILTSSNLPGLPITTKRSEQFVENILDHDRKILNFSDDSIVKVLNTTPLLIRRSRGYVPSEIKIPKNYQTSKDDILAVGAEQKSTFCLKKGNNLILSQELGNTKTLECLENFKASLQNFLKLTNIKPKLILCDAHPNFNTTHFAKEFAKTNKIPLIQIQHHKSHIFSAALEHNLLDFTAIAVDGTGWGSDGTVWGGEVFHNDKRIGTLEAQTLIGGDIANKESIRILIAILSKFLTETEIKNLIKKIVQHIEPKTVTSILKQQKQNFNCIKTSSAGRILDAVAALLGINFTNDYEARGAQMLESLNMQNTAGANNTANTAGVGFRPAPNISVAVEEPTSRSRPSHGSHPHLASPIRGRNSDVHTLKTTPLFQYLVKNLNKKPKPELVQIAQIYLAKGFLKIAKTHSSSLPTVISGGCTYNEIITTHLTKNKVLTNREIPPGDAGISAGQIAYYLWQKSKVVN